MQTKEFLGLESILRHELVPTANIKHFSLEYADVVSCWKLIVIALSVLYLINAFIKYYRSPLRQIPGPRGYPIIRNAMEMSEKVDSHKTLLRWIQEYGHVYKFSLPFVGDIVFVSDPDLVKQILVTDESSFDRCQKLHVILPDAKGGLVLSNRNDNRHQRKRLNPYFSLDSVKRCTSLFNESVDKLIDLWSQKVTKSTESMTKEYMLKAFQNLSLEIIGKASFGYDFNCILGQETEESQSVTKLLCCQWNVVMRSLENAFPILKWFPSAERTCVAETRKVFRNLVKKMVDNRSKENNNSESREDFDLLQVILEMCTDDSGKRHDSGIFPQVFSFMLGGFETTSVALTWTLYLLAKHQDKQTKVREEIKERLIDQAEVTWEVSQNLTYLKQCIDESLRLFPPVPRNVRCATRDIKVGPYVIPAGTSVVLGIGTLHRDPRYWENPDDFIPERFQKGDFKHTAHTFTYQPFSRGPRTCIGKRFAESQLLIVLAKLLQKFHFAVPEGHPDVGARADMALRPYPSPVLEIREI